MSVIIQGPQLRVSQFGIQVVKGTGTPVPVGVAGGLTLPQTATATLATVAGGAVMVTTMLGLVTTVIGGACNLSLGTAPTTGTAETAGIAAAAALSTAEAGTWLVPLVNAGLGGTLVNGGHAGSCVFLPTPFIVEIGTITWTTSASVTGAIKWYFTYVALDNGAALS